MPEFEADFMARATGGTWKRSLGSGRVTSYTQDSRQAGPGCCFVALRTNRRDGHDFIGEARRAGAVAALVDREVADPLPQLLVPNALKGLQDLGAAHRQCFSGKVVGITGSCGKTTTRGMLEMALGKGVHATQGNLNNEIGLPLTLLRLDQNEHWVSVVETGINRRGEMEVLARILAPDLAIFTMVGEAHLDGLSSVDGVAREKLNLFQHLREGGRGVFSESAWAIPIIRDWVREHGGEVCLPHDSDGEGSDGVSLWFRRVEALAEGRQRLYLGEAAGEAKLELMLWGMSPGMISNLALAAIAALRLGVSSEAVVERLEGWSPLPMRGDWREVGQMRILLDCYNSNPSSMADSLDWFFEKASGAADRVFILGGMSELGTAAGALHERTVDRHGWKETDEVFLVGDLAKAFLVGLRRGVLKETSIHQLEAAEDLREVILGWLGAGRKVDIFVKGSRSAGLEKVFPPELGHLLLPIENPEMTN
ncbi:MAG: UDP-N-acetylmuramoyl-tripeptide--D-alanyl-D-alanine ligase [Puniceicoccaceae bacterium]